MEKAIGNEYVAAGSSFDEKTPEMASNFFWDYKGNCVELHLYANRRLFVTEIPRDEGLVTFANCDSDSYMDMPPRNAEPEITDPALLKQKNEWRFA